MSTKISRRTFLSTLSAGMAVAAGANIIHPPEKVAAFKTNQKRMAILGGTPVVKNKVLPT